MNGPLLKSDPSLVRTLKGERQARPPVWFMRQAGRYLPEYRALREKAANFIAFCLNPEMAAEATLQPMRRFSFDAAIVFADILLIPMALGQAVWFEAGEGPKLGPMPAVAAMRDAIETAAERLAAVGETLTRVRAALEPERALIGFAGGPWTVATYMIEGGSSDRTRARAYAYERPVELDSLIEILVEATVRYLIMQARSGAQAFQLFESWAENLPEPVFERIVTRPHAAIVEKLRSAGVTIPVIGFPRGAGGLIETYAGASGVTAVGLDVAAPAALGRRLQQSMTIQGALDPILLRAGGAALDERIDQLLAQWGMGPYVFNLGHGILPDTPVAHVEQALARIAAWPAASA